jgi:hypothetical protein
MSSAPYSSIYATSGVASLRRHREFPERRRSMEDHAMFLLDDHILAFGSCIVGAGLLGTSLLALLFRHPNPPRWTRPEIVAMLVCIPVTVTTGLGLGYVAFGLSRLLRGAGDPRELLVLAGVIVALALVWRWLRIGRRLKDYAAVTDAISPRAYLATEPTLVIDEMPPPSPTPPAHRPARKAA